jgi:3'-phosphoadenosine 5'-phosphosulfate sulfotransferase (PAPS reductase)/FAD synthetase
MHILPSALVNQVLDETPDELHQHLEHGADLIISVSGGKDSDAMTYILDAAARMRAWPGRIVLAHADLGRMDWPQTAPHIISIAESLQRPLHIVRRDGGDLLDGMRQRYETMKANDHPNPIPFPSSKARWCTGSYKRDAIAKFERQFTPEGVIIDAQGIRKDESLSRSEYDQLATKDNITSQKRIAFNWYPIFNFSVEDVWHTCGTSSERLAELRIQAQSLRTVISIPQIIDWIGYTDWKNHCAYVLGAERLSCSLCFLANRPTLEAGAEGNPEVYRQIVALEIESRKSFQPSRWLGSIRPDLLEDHQRQALEAITGQRFDGPQTHQPNLV